MIKNEAHVRLSSTMWYMVSNLLSLSIIGMLILALSSIITFFVDESLSIYIVPFMLIVLAFGFSLWVRKKIEEFLHYQRVREIVHVLETAFIASKVDDRNILFSEMGIEISKP
jgi:hypothetical protein